MTNASAAKKVSADFFTSGIHAATATMAQPVPHYTIGTAAPLRFNSTIAAAQVAPADIKPAAQAQAAPVTMAWDDAALRGNIRAQAASGFVAGAGLFFSAYSLIWPAFVGQPMLGIGALFAAAGGASLLGLHRELAQDAPKEKAAIKGNLRRMNGWSALAGLSFFPAAVTGMAAALWPASPIIAAFAAAGGICAAGAALAYRDYRGARQTFKAHPSFPSPML